MKFPVPPRRAFRHALAGLLPALLLLWQGAGAAEPEYPAVIRTIMGHGIQVEKSFPAASGLTGWVITDGQEFSVVYTTPDGQTLLHGNLIDTRGMNLTAMDAQSHIPRPDYTEAYAALAGAESVTEGAVENPVRTVYVFFDPNCPFCHAAWSALQAYEKKGLQVRWIPVAYLRDSSAPKAAAMLEAEDRTAAFRRIMADFGADDGKWNGRPVGPDSVAALKANAALMSRFGFRGTPSFVYRDAEGVVQVKNGMPRLAEFAEISGLPEQPQSDPRLAQFR